MKLNEAKLSRGGQKLYAHKPTGAFGAGEDEAKARNLGVSSERGFLFGPDAPLTLDFLFPFSCSPPVPSPGKGRQVCAAALVGVVGR